MKVLFLHGWNSVPGGVKPTYLKDHGHEVVNPALPHEDFEMAVRIAQAEFDKHEPDVVVGSSRGGAVAMNIDSGDAKLVLLCPAWKKYGTAKTVKPGTVILHSRADDVVSFADSEELVRSSGLPAYADVYPTGPSWIDSTGFTVEASLRWGDAGDGTQLRVALQRHHAVVQSSRSITNHRLGGYRRLNVQPARPVS
jgi:hypothetical protein